MNNKQQAFEDLKRFSRTFRGLFEIGEELAQVGDIEEATKRAKADLAQVLSDIAAKQQEFDAAMEETKAKHAEGDASLAAAKTEADRIISDAKSNAESIRTRASTDALTVQSKVVADTKSKLDAEHEQHKQKLSSIQQEIVSHQSRLDKAIKDHNDYMSLSAKEVVERKAVIADLTKRIEKHQTNHDEITAQLEALKARFK